MSAHVVTVSASDLPKPASALAEAVHAEADRSGCCEVTITVSDDETELTAQFRVDAADVKAANKLGHAILDSLGIDSFAWSVAVLEPFSSTEAGPEAGR